MRLALAIVSLAFVLVTLAAATFDTDTGRSEGPRMPSLQQAVTSTARGDATSARAEIAGLEPARVESTIWIPGQFGRDGDRWGEGPGDQARIAFRNLEAELEQVGGSLDDVVELTTYHRDLDSLEEFRRIKSEVFGSREPAWTAVAVSDLVEPESLVEIKATAVIGASR